MIISIVKRYCICGGPCNIGDVLETTPTEYMVEITAKKTPRSNLLTRGANPARVVAHDLAFDRRKIGSAADDFKMLYASCQGCPLEFWTITVTKGEKATLKLLAIDEAEKLFIELPQKLYSHTFLFDPERYKRQAAEDRAANMTLKAEERERREVEEWNALGPLGRFGKSPPVKGWG